MGHRLRELFARLTWYASRGRVERDLDREIRAHLDLMIEEHRRRGRGAEEARIRALQALGGVEQTKEAHRDQRGFPSVDAGVRDLTHAWRLLRARPWTSAAIIVSMALGIGANTAVFSVAYGVLWRPLPFAEPDRLLRLYQAKGEQAEGRVSPLNYQDWAQRSTSLAQLAAWRPWTYEVATRDGKEPIAGARVSASLFGVLGVQPVKGRAFSAAEDTPSGEPVAVISDRLWRTRFAGQDDAIGRALIVGETSFTIVGVLPARVTFPSENTDIWTPLRLGDGTHRMRRSENYLDVIARPRRDVALVRVRDDLTHVANVLAAEFPQTNAGSRIAAVPLTDVISGGVRLPLLLLLAAAGAVLLISSANVAHLLLARASARRRELALRAALGATRARLLWQSVSEMLLLAAIGCSAGVAAASLAIDALRPFLPAALPRHADIAVDPMALGYALACTLLVGALCAVAPALFAWHTSLDDTLKSAPRTVAGGASSLGRFVIVVQVTLSLVLLVATLLIVQSLRNLLTADAGFDSHQVVVMQVSLQGTAVMQNNQFQAARVVQHFEQAVERVRQIRGVEAAGLVNHVPLGGEGSGTRFTMERRPPSRPEDVSTADYRVVSPSYFHTLRARLLRGRHLTTSDRPETMRVCLINESMARRYWPNEDPVNSRIRRGGLDSTQPYITIVGVVADMKQQGLDREVAPEIFIPHTQFPWPDMNLAVRSAREVQEVAPEVRAALLDLNPLQSVQAVRPLDDVVWRTLSGRTFTSGLLSAASGLALMLALLGVYAIVAYATSRRSKEIAIRVALGGQPSSILRALFGQTMGLVAFALGLGTLGAYAVARVMTHQLFGVSAFDPVTYAAAALAVGLVALVAALEPARRALRVNPLMLLRVE